MLTQDLDATAGDDHDAVIDHRTLLVDGGDSTENGGEFVTQSELARRFNCSRQHISNRVGDGTLAEAARGDLFDVTVARRLLADRTDGRRRQGGMLIDLTEDDRRLKQAKIRQAEAQADLAETERQKRVGELVDARAMAAQQFTLARQLRDLLLAVPADMADQLSVSTDPREIRTLLISKLRSILNDFVASIDGESQ